MERGFGKMKLNEPGRYKIKKEKFLAAGEAYVVKGTLYIVFLNH